MAIHLSLLETLIIKCYNNPNEIKTHPTLPPLAVSLESSSIDSQSPNINPPPLPRRQRRRSNPPPESPQLPRSNYCSFPRPRFPGKRDIPLRLPDRFSCSSPPMRAGHNLSRHPPNHRLGQGRPQNPLPPQLSLPIHLQRLFIRFPPLPTSSSVGFSF